MERHELINVHQLETDRLELEITKKENELIREKSCIELWLSSLPAGTERRLKEKQLVLINQALHDEKEIAALSRYTLNQQHKIQIDSLHK